jgi:hypothetical protein
MPSATAILSLNVSAIKILCRVPAINSGMVAPSAGIGYKDDFYFDRGTEYPIYDLYGPKETDTSNWPDLSAGIRIPSVSLIQSISATLFSNITALSTNVVDLSATSVTITNSGTSVALTVAQNDASTSAFNVASFKYMGSPILTINKSFVGINKSSPGNALDVVGNVNITGSIFAASQSMPTLSAQILNVNFANIGELYSSGNASLADVGFKITTSPSGPGDYRIVTVNVDPVSSFVFSLSNYTAVFASPNSTLTRPVMIANTSFKVVSGNFNTGTVNIDNFFVVDPTSAARVVTCSGLLTAASAQYETTYDSSHKQLLTSRQAYGPTHLTTQSASATLIDQWNLLISALTAHGLIM